MSNKSDVNTSSEKSLIREPENVTIIPRKNKKRNDIKIATSYDKLISSSYTLQNGELDKEKIANQKMSFILQK